MHLFEIPRVVEFIETESRMVAANQGNRGVGSAGVMNTEFQLRKMKRVLEMDGDDGGITK